MVDGLVHSRHRMWRLIAVNYEVGKQYLCERVLARDGENLHYGLVFFFCFSTLISFFPSVFIYVYYAKKKEH